MRIAILSDLHGHLPPVPACDLLLLGGDLCPPNDHATAAQTQWLDGPFRRWLGEAPAPVIGIAGNHDFVFQRQPDQVPDDLPWTYLEDSSTLVGGLRIWGSPWTPWFHDWAFNAPREDGEAFLASRYADIPEATDVLLIHGPPRGYGDRTTTGAEAGSAALLEVIDRLHPRLCAFGHIHEARGRWAHGPTELVNASAVDELYDLRPEPAVLLDL